LVSSSSATTPVACGVAAEVPLLPPLERPQVARALGDRLAADERYASEPLFDGRPAETGAVGRLAAHPLVAALSAAFGRSTLTRLAARVTELARIAAGVEAPAPLCGALALAGARCGLGWVETARGALVHLIELDAGASRIARYRILAPTEWNFHPRGALAAGLLGAHAASEAELRRRAQWLVQALDPCVGYRLQIEGGHA